MQNNYNIQSGAAVYGSDGSKIGSVKNCTDTYCHVDTGFLGLGQDYFVPFNAIQTVRDGDIYLNIPSDQIGQMGWNQKPAAARTAGHTTMTGTVPTGNETVAERNRTYGRETVAGPNEPYNRSVGPAGEARRIPLEEEELQIQRQRQQVGDVTVGTNIQEEQRTFTVPVSHEEVVITERPASGPARRPVGAEGEIARIPLTEEEITVQKHPEVYGEIVVEKRNVTEQQRVSETVRKEVPDVNATGQARKFVRVEGAENTTENPNNPVENPNNPPETRRNQRP